MQTVHAATEHIANVGKRDREIAEARHSAIEHASQELRSREQRVRNPIRQRRSAFGVDALESFDKRQELFGECRDDRCEVAGHLTDDAFDRLRHECERVVKLRDVRDLIVSHDDAEPLRTLPHLLDGVPLLLEQGRESNALLAEHAERRTGSLRCRRELRDPLRDQCELILGRETSQLLDRQSELPQPLREFCRRVRSPDVRREPLEGRTEFIGRNAGELGRHAVALQSLAADAGT